MLFWKFEFEILNLFEICDFVLGAYDTKIADDTKLIASTTMKVIIATPLYPPEIGGPATYAALLERELPKSGIGVTVLPMSVVGKRPKVRGRIVYLWRLYKHARKSDIVMALDPVSVGFPAALAAFVARRPLVVRVAGDYAWEQGTQRFGVVQNLDDFVSTPLACHPLPVQFFRRVESFVARRAYRVIVPSEYLKKIVMLWGVNPACFVVVYNAFHSNDMSKTERPGLRKKFNIYGTIIFSAGRFVPWKGFRTLVRMMPEIVAVIPEATLYIAGSGPEGETLRKEIAAYGLERHVRLLGDLSHVELMERIAAADIFVLNTGYEGFSHQLLEVMAAGTPLVTTAVGGNPELVEHGKTGLLVPYDDPAALRGAILALYENKDRAWTLAAQAQAYVGRFTEKRMIEETVNVLRDAAKR